MNLPTEQLDLTLALESGEALLLPREARRKLYTAENARSLEWQEDCILTMIATGVIPLDTIAQRAHVNFRIVQTLATREAERIGGDAMRFSEYAAAKAAKFMFLADQKGAEASAKDCGIIHGIFRDTMLALRTMDAGAGLEPAIEVNANESDALRKFREGLKQLQNVGTRVERVPTKEGSAP